MADAVSVCNLALIRVGVVARIAALDENSAEADACAAVLDLAIETVLRSRPWPFARQVVELGLVASDYAPGWASAYRWPYRALAIRSVLPPVDQGDEPQPFDIASDDGGALILTNAEAPARCAYTAKVDLARWPPDVVDALAWRIAADIAIPLARTGTIRDAAAANYRLTVSEASARALNESMADPTAGYLASLREA